MQPNAAKPRTGNNRRRVLYVFLLAAIVVALAPTIVGLAGVHNSVLRRLLPRAAGSLTAAGASLGWFSPTELRSVRLSRPDGEVLLEVSALTSDHTFLQLLRHRGELGRIRVQQPRLHVVAGADGSNLEDFIRNVLAGDEPSTPLTGTIEVAGGSVQVVDTRTGHETRMAIEQLTCRLVRTNVESLHAELVAPSDAPQQSTAENAAGGTLELRLTTRADAMCELEVSATDWPIQAGSPWLRRLVDDAEATGRLTLEATTAWTAASSFESSGSATLADLQLAAAPLANDRVRLGKVRVPWKIKRRGKHLLVDELSLTSEVAQLALHGELPLEPELFTRRTAWDSIALRVPLTASGTLDLARLTSMLPSTLRVRDGVIIDSGRSEFLLESIPGEDAHRWSGKITVSDLSARDKQRSLQWEQPVAVAASIRHDGAWTVESLTCQSDFLQIEAEGDRRRMNAQVDFDLARLTAKLEQFVDIARWQLGGRGTLLAQWRPHKDGSPLRATVNGSINGLRWFDGQGRLWQEPSVQLQADVVLSLPGRGGPLTIERGSQVTLSTAKDRALARLDGPLVVPQSIAEGLQQVGPAWVEVEGDLAAWSQRLSPWLEPTPWRVGGTAKLTSQWELRKEAVSASSLEAVLTDLKVVGPGWRIVEPRVTLETSGDYHLTDRAIRLGETTVVGRAASVRARDMSITWGDGRLPPQLRGEAVFRAALERIDAWRIGTDGRPIPTRPAGMVAGSLRLDREKAGPTAHLTATISDLAIYEYVTATRGRQAGYRPSWTEPKLELIAATTYRQEADEWTIQEAAIRSNSLEAAVVGTLSDVTGPCNADLRGTVQYDLADFGPVVAAQTGLDLTLSGREQATFEVVGPLRPSSAGAAQAVNMHDTQMANLDWSRRLRGQMTAGWESMRLFGLPFGQGRIDAALEGGVITFAPLDVSVGPDGRLTASAKARLSPSPSELRISPGPMIHRVEITPDVSTKLLKYFIPALADAIETQGRFSLATEGGRVPLRAPAAMEAAGTLTVHQAAVRPGRVGRDWILLAEQIEAALKNRQLPQALTRPQRDLLTIDDQAVAYRVAGGRVHHENLTFMIGDIPVHSRGSVGFDESLLLEIEVPVQDQWIADKPRLARFQGRSIRGTIRGTFDRLDYGTLLADLAEQVGRGVVEGALEHELNRALDRLFNTRQ